MSKNLIKLIENQFQRYIDYKDSIDPPVYDARETYRTDEGVLMSDFDDSHKIALMYAGEPPNEIKIERIDFLQSEIYKLSKEKDEAKHGEKGSIQSQIDTAKKALNALKNEISINNNKKRASLIIKRLMHACDF